MALTLPTNFANRQDDMSSSGCWVLEVATDGSSGKHYFADRPMAFAGESIDVEAALLETTPIRQSYNHIFSVYELAHFQFTLAGQNSQRATDGTWLRVLDYIYDSHGRTIKVYWWPGGTSTALVADSLLIFTGTVTRIEYVSDNRVVIDTDERDFLGHTPLPQRLMNTATFPDLASDKENATMPLVWGAFTEGDFHPKWGMVKCELIGAASDDGFEFKWLAADHVVSALGPLWFYYRNIDSWAKANAGVTYNVSDGGRATVEIADTDSVTFDMYLYPTGPTGKAFDLNSDTRAEILATSTTVAEVTFLFEQVGGGDDDIVQNEIAEFLQVSSVADVDFFYKIEKVTGFSVTDMEYRFHVAGAWTSYRSFTHDTEDTGIFRSDAVGNIYDWTGTDGVFWHPGTGAASATTQSPLKFQIRVTGQNFTVGLAVGFIYSLSMKIACQMSHTFVVQKNFTVYDARGGHPQTTYWIETTQFLLGAKDLEDSGTVYCEVDGRKFGSWVDDGGRSNSFNSGDVIDRAPYIVESILRDELSKVNADIDTASFDAVNTDGARPGMLALKSGTSEDSKDIIDQLCHDHFMVLVTRPTGEFKLLSTFGDSTGTVTQTLTPQDIIGVPLLGLTDIRSIINNVTFHWGRSAIDGRPTRTELRTYAASITRFGTLPGTIRAPSVFDTTEVDGVLDQLVDDGAGTGFSTRSWPHVEVRFFSRGAHLAHLELGDHLNFSTDFDQLMKVFSKSWSSKKITITGIERTQFGIAFECLEFAQFVY